MRILQIAYHYPPMGGAGVQRALKFSKYLPDFGIEPVVLAAHDPGYVVDASLVDEIPAGVEVHRVEHRPLLPRLLAWRRSRQAATVSTTPSVASPARSRARDIALAGYAALQFPDDKAAWARRAWPVARALLQRRPVDLIFSSAPPVSAHALGARLAREFGIPWVADYRDLWTEISNHGAPAWRAALDRHTEDGWLRHAAGVVTVTPSWQRLLAARLGPTRPVAFVPNGYDEHDFAGLAALPPRPADFVLTHTGTFYGPRDPGALLDGVGRYLARSARPARRLRIRLVGNMGARFDARLAGFDVRHPGVVERVPYRPHHEALAEIVAADALLLVVGGWQGAGGAGLLPGKIFEYLRAAKPVLLLGATEGDAAEMIRRHARGVVVDEAQPERIADALQTLVDGDTLVAPAIPEVGRFERRALAAELAAFLVACRARGGR